MQQLAFKFCLEGFHFASAAEKVCVLMKRLPESVRSVFARHPSLSGIEATLQSSFEGMTNCAPNGTTGKPCLIVH